MPAFIQTYPFNPWHYLECYQAEHVQSGHFGATACFVGSMRDMNLGDNVSSMTLEHYPQMTGKFLDALCQKYTEQFALHDALIVHRVGTIQPGEPIVLVAAWSAHRDAAFKACREMMEALKAGAPFWKKETTQQGERWVHNDLTSSDDKPDTP